MNKTLGAVILLHLLGWVLLVAAPSVYPLALIAWLLGIRHALDIDHLLAIDNTTRKLADENKPAKNVGFYFSLGHSTVVVVITLLALLGVTILNTQTKHYGQQISGLISALFLYLTATLNLINKQTPTQKLIKPLTKTIDKQWKMYPIGLLFGLGFDTATSISILALATTTTLINPYTVIALPILFTAGMAGTDALNGYLVWHLYNWAKYKTQQHTYYRILTYTTSLLAIIMGTVILTETLK